MRRLILRESLDIFRKHGLAGLTMRAIAKRINYSPAAIYRYYPAKQDIIRALSIQGFQLFNEWMDPLHDMADLRERLREGARTYIRFAMANPLHYELMFHTPGPLKPHGDGDEEGPPRRAFNDLLQLVTRCMEAGVLTRGEPLPVAVALWSALHGLASLLTHGRLVPLCPEGETDRVVDEAVQFTLRNV
jgi:AcrR family transcriptional regulator